MPRTISRSATSGNAPDITTVTEWFREFVLTQNTIKKLNERLGAVKKNITAAVEALGEEDEKGHLLLPIEGVEGYSAAQRQRKVSTSLNEDALRAIVGAKDSGDELLKGCYKLVPVLEEDAVYALYADGTITDDELDTIFPKSVSYAFIPLRG